MTEDVRRSIAAFAHRRVLVLGEAMLDRYLHGTADRLCREAPVPVVHVERTVDEPGGAANTAVNVRCLGGCVTLLSVIGDDEDGARLQEALRERGLSTDEVLVRPSRRTLAKHRVMAGTQLLVRFDQGSTSPLEPRIERALIARLVELFARSDAVIVSDYSYGILTPRVIKTLAHLQAASPRVLVVDAREPALYCSVGATAVKPNYEEVVRLLDEAATDMHDRAAWVGRHGERLLAMTGARIVAATLDSEGAVFFDRHGPSYRTYTQPIVHGSATGAGDTFVSALTLALATGAPMPIAAELAASAAAIVVGKEGTASCSAHELVEYLGPQGKYCASCTSLTMQVEIYRQRQRRIVFTNGCFDILHRGHVTLLNRAKALGDVLIVGVNSDAGIARLKGPDRPINSLEDRVQLLAALSCVDLVIAFDDDTPIDLIRTIRPDVFVKGGDYTRESLPETPIVEALGGRVQILPYVQNRSTSAILERLRQGSDQPRKPEHGTVVQARLRRDVGVA